MMTSQFPGDYLRKDESLLLSLQAVIEPKHTGLLIVDVQNDFVFGKDKVATPVGAEKPRESIITSLNAFIEKCRDYNVSVIYLQTIHSGDLDLPPYKARMIKRGEGPVCMFGSRGAAFPDALLKPLPQDAIVTKSGYDGFSDTNLKMILQNRGIKTIIFAGIDSAVCVDTTVRHGFHLGYYIVVAGDLCASFKEERQRVAFDIIQTYYGQVIKSQEIINVWSK